MKQTGSAIWRGDLKSGVGALSTHSGALHETPYGFAMRFEGAKGTNPEELIAAAHAGCFTMALTANLGKAGFTPKRLATSVTVTDPPSRELVDVVQLAVRLGGHEEHLGGRVLGGVGAPATPV